MFISGFSANMTCGILLLETILELLEGNTFKPWETASDKGLIGTVGNRALPSLLGYLFVYIAKQKQTKIFAE